MGETLMTLEDIQRYVGVEAPPHTVHMETELVRRYVDAVQDPNPLWTDEDYASATHWKGTMVPPYIFCALMMITKYSPETGVVPLPAPNIPLPRRNVLEGEETWEFFAPVRVGDVITSRVRLSDVKLREGRLGAMFIMTYDAESVNQRGELVARSSNTIVNY
ncbi:MAG: MaoC family dehydratase N-terminal domain-containing protein [Dehalococcoidia bacterium]|nr:MaoC family dehydratase N-terminal domain-containing protein [Dehalococcoidia bacterium]